MNFEKRAFDVVEDTFEKVAKTRYAKWIEEAKDPEEKARRVNKVTGQKVKKDSILEQSAVKNMNSDKINPRKDKSGATRGAVRRYVNETENSAGNIKDATSRMNSLGNGAKQSPEKDIKFNVDKKAPRAKANPPKAMTNFMKNHGKKLGVAGVAAAGTGAAYLAGKKIADMKREKTAFEIIEDTLEKVAKTRYAKWVDEAEGPTERALRVIKLTGGGQKAVEDESLMLDAVDGLAPGSKREGSARKHLRSYVNETENSAGNIKDSTNRMRKFENSVKQSPVQSPAQSPVQSPVQSPKKDIKFNVDKKAPRAKSAPMSDGVNIKTPPKSKTNPPKAMTNFMRNHGKKLGVAGVAAAGTGAAYLAGKKIADMKREKTAFEIIEDTFGKISN